MIDKYTIDLIYDRADIVEVISDFIKLRKAGVNYLGHCPFHTEKTPSFTVSPVKRIFKCFGCGKSGNVVGFVMDHENLTYVEALRYLAKKYHIEVQEKELEPEDIQQRNQREALQTLTNFAGTWFKNTLHNTDEGKSIGLSYFRERKFTDVIVEKFQLGYSPSNRNAFADFALKNGYKKELLLESGLVTDYNNTLLDRFHDRVIFPIHSITGQILGFGGRTMKDDKKNAKYVNSPETLLYQKSQTLYGIFFARKAITQNDKCFLVEGYTDVLSMFQSGVENVVASSGTSLTVEQIRLIKRYTKNLTVIYDGDAAGIKASQRGIDMILAEDMNVKLCLLPDGEDPDSFARKKSSTEFVDFIKENETDFISFKIQLTYESTKKDPLKRSALINEIIQTISNIPDLITRSVYIKQCSVLFEMSEEILHQATNKKIKEVKEKEASREFREHQLSEKEIITPEKPKRSQKEIEKEFEVTENELIRVLIEYGDKAVFSQPGEKKTSKIFVTLAEYIIEELDRDGLTPKDPLLIEIYETYINALKSGVQLSSFYFSQHPDIRISSKVADMIAPGYTLSKIWDKTGGELPLEENRLSVIVETIVIEYKKRRLRDVQKELSKKLSNPNLTEKEIMELTVRLDEINVIKQKLTNITKLPH